MGRLRVKYLRKLTKLLQRRSLPGRDAYHYHRFYGQLMRWHRFGLRRMGRPLARPYEMCRVGCLEACVASFEAQQLLGGACVRARISPALAGAHPMASFDSGNVP